MRLLARHAEGLFWLGRYLERAAALSRIVEMQSAFGGHQEQDEGWVSILKLYADETRFRERHRLSGPAIVEFYVTDPENPGSIRSSIAAARENARAMRAFIPLEMWVQLNDFHDWVTKLGVVDIGADQLPRTCARIGSGCFEQIGIAENTLFRDEGYIFFKLGILIERADQTSRLLDVKFAQASVGTFSHDPADEFVFWTGILRKAAAYRVFQRLEREAASPDRIARFLILNPSHPRAIGFCVREIGDALQMLRGSFHLHKASAAMESCELLLDGLQAAAADRNLADHLHAFNDWVQRALMDLASRIETAFFPRSVTQAQSQSQSQS